MVKSTAANNPHYFEAVIQLRPYNDEVFDFIQHEMKKYGPTIFISRILKLKTGIDIYISSQKFARMMGQLMKKKFKNGTLLITEKFHTWDRLRSRKLSRATVLFRLNPKRDEEE